MEQSSPQLVVTDQHGRAREDIPPSRGSYITELNSLHPAGKPDGTRPFDNILRGSRSRQGISQVKMMSAKKE